MTSILANIPVQPSSGGEHDQVYRYGKMMFYYLCLVFILYHKIMPLFKLLTQTFLSLILLYR